MIAETCLIITINDTSLGYLPLIINISYTCKNQTKRLDFDNTINLSSLIVILVPGYNHPGYTLKTGYNHPGVDDCDGGNGGGKEGGRGGDSVTERKTVRTH